MITLTATPAPGHHLDHWSGDIDGCQYADLSVSIPMDRPREVTAVFALTLPAFGMTTTEVIADYPEITWPTAPGLTYQVYRSHHPIHGYEVIFTTTAVATGSTIWDSQATDPEPYYYRIAADNGYDTLWSDNVMGFMRIRIRANNYTLMSIPFSKRAVESGVISGHDGSVITVNGAGWVPGEFAEGVVGQEAMGASTFYVEIDDTNSNFLGRRLYVETNGEDTLTIRNDLPSDMASPADMLAGVSFRIVPCHRIRDVFGEPGDPALHGDFWPEDADQILFWKEGGGWDNAIYYMTLIGDWVRGTDQVADLPIDRDRGFFVKRFLDSDTEVALAGEVRPYGQAIEVRPGYNLLGGWPAERVVGNTTLSQVVDGAFWPEDADTILEWKETGGWESDVYFMTLINEWVRGSVSVDATFSIETGRGYFLYLKGAQTPRIWMRRSAFDE